MPWTPRGIRVVACGGDVQGIVNQWCVDQPGRSVGRIGWPLKAADNGSGHYSWAVAACACSSGRSARGRAAVSRGRL